MSQKQPQSQSSTLKMSISHCGAYISTAKYNPHSKERHRQRMVLIPMSLAVPPYPPPQPRKYRSCKHQQSVQKQEESLQNADIANTTSMLCKKEIHQQPLQKQEESSQSIEIAITPSTLCSDTASSCWIPQHVGKDRVLIASKSDTRLKQGIPTCCMRIMEMAGMDNIVFRFGKAPFVQVGMNCKEYLEHGLELARMFALLHTPFVKVGADSREYRDRGLELARIFALLRTNYDKVVTYDRGCAITKSSSTINAIRLLRQGQDPRQGKHSSRSSAFDLCRQAAASSWKKAGGPHEPRRELVLLPHGVHFLRPKDAVEMLSI